MTKFKNRKQRQFSYVETSMSEHVDCNQKLVKLDDKVESGLYKIRHKKFWNRVFISILISRKLRLNFLALRYSR